MTDDESIEEKRADGLTEDNERLKWKNKRLEMERDEAQEYIAGLERELKAAKAPTKTTNIGLIALFALSVLIAVAVLMYLIAVAVLM